MDEESSGESIYLKFHSESCHRQEKNSTFREVFGFFSRGEKQILDKVLRNLDVSIDAAKHLQTLVSSLQRYDYDNVNSEYKAIAELEEKGDELHRSLVREIVTGSFFGGIREDFLNLLEWIDSVADEAKDAAKLFHLRRVPKETVDYLFKEDVMSFISALVRTTLLFRESIMALHRGKIDVLTLTEKVEKSEEEADAIRYTIIENLLKNEISANVLDVITLRDFLNTADDVADSAEYGSDVMQILVSKGYS